MGQIKDIVVKRLVTHSDDRGFFREVLRADEGLLKQFGQTAITKTYPGVIKAFHWHKKQDDVWYVADGMVRIVLHDLRENSPTKGQTQVIYAGEDQQLIVYIPSGVAHGYQVLGHKPAILLYHVTQPYNPKDPDEERIPYDDPTIGFDWSIKNR
ncbi:MAG: dTDP-4-dehydrorhamnose 3,5-epimerase family protein [Chloroflexi bacterium]|nr:dTDP-4-dehydrorhamnose 3,5-epimerase family protein [Chloroflexota bacterium]